MSLVAQPMEAILKNSAFGYLSMSGADFLIENCNPFLEEQLKANKVIFQQIQGKPLLEAFPILKGTFTSKLIQKVFESGKASNTIENILLGKKLSTLLISCIKNESNRIELLIFDITDFLFHATLPANNLDNGGLGNLFEIGIASGKVGIWHWNIKTNQLTWSKEQEEIYGLSPGEFSGAVEEFINYVHPEDINLLNDLAIGKDITDHQYQFRILKRNGESRWIQSRSRKHYDKNGDLYFLTGINIDITDYKLQQLKLEESANQFINLANALPQVVWVAESNGEVTYYNDNVLNFSGVRRMENGNWRWEGFVHKDDLEPTQQAWMNAVANGVVYEKEHRILMKDGAFRWYLSRAIPLKDLNGKIVRWYGTATDIHDQKTAVEKAKESEARFRSLAENSPDLITRHGKDFKYLYASPIIEQFTGIKAESFIGKSYWEMGLPDYMCKFFDESLKAAFQKKSLHTVEYSMPNNLGYIHSRMMPEFDEEGNVVSILIVSTDITERKRVEEKLIKINNDLDNFIYTASHDLKAPVSNIEGLVNVLKDLLNKRSENRTDIDMAIGMIEESIAKFAGTIQDLTTVSKLEKDQEEIKPINVRELIEDIQVSIRDMILNSGASINIQTDEFPEIKFSKKNLKSIIYNLINNAIKYKSPDRNPHVFIQTQKNGDFVLITIEDNGLGISKENQGKLFNMFKRFHDHVDGSGLGLYIVKRIIDNSGGNIEVESTVGKGTKFKISLPAS